MLWKEFGLIFLALVAILVAGNLWFHVVEALLARVRGLLGGRKEPPAWHPLPPEREDKD